MKKILHLTIATAFFFLSISSIPGFAFNVNVVQGNATVSTSGNTVTINATSKAILQGNTSIPANVTVKVVQGLNDILLRDTTGSVSGGSSYVGGLVGYNNSSNIDNSYATGNVSGSIAVGGLVGQDTDTSSITNSYATGTVSGSGYYIGGLVGVNGSTNITNSYATGNVSAASNAGGLIGYDAFLSTIDNSYATGSVSSSGGNVGGLIGYDNGTNTLTNNWWYNSLSNGVGSSGSPTNTGHWDKASGVSNFYSSSFSVYTGSSPWDFTSVWYPPSSAYPLLR